MEVREKNYVSFKFAKFFSVVIAYIYIFVTSLLVIHSNSVHYKIDHITMDSGGLQFHIASFYELPKLMLTDFCTFTNIFIDSEMI